jgi:hypothetical protein
MQQLCRHEPPCYAPCCGSYTLNPRPCALGQLFAQLDKIADGKRAVECCTVILPAIRTTESPIPLYNDVMYVGIPYITNQSGMDDEM